MRKKLLSFVALAAIVFLGACSNEELLPEPDQTFTFSATMPDDNPTTRVTLTEEGKDIALRWETDDTMPFVVTQGSVSFLGTSTIQPNSINSDGKKALFNATPSTPTTGFNPNQPFNFYGVYGGRGLAFTNPTNALLPDDPSASRSLDEVQENNDVMLYFAHENVTTSQLQNGVTLNHLGSLFNITVKNNCDTGILNLEAGAQLYGVNNNNNDDWAYDFTTVGTVFDLTSGTFKNTGTGINVINFSTSTVQIAPGEEVTYWSWYPILPNNTWPELKLVLNSANPNNLITANSKPIRNTPAIAGKNYRFYAEFDGVNFNFTNDQFVVTP